MSDKTEAPSPRRMQEARERGQVARSVDLGAAFSLMAGIWLLQGQGSNLLQGFAGMVTGSIARLPKLDLTQQKIWDIAIEDVSMIITPFVSIILTLMAIGVGLSLAQTGFIWATKRKFVDFSRVNPLSGIKRMFSTGGLVELLKSLSKLLVVGWVAYSYLTKNVDALLVLSQMDLMAGLTKWASLAFGLVWQVGGAYLVIAIADYLWQRRQFMNQMKMSKQEVKEEYKQSEGDPHVKARIRAIQRQVSRRRMMAAVPKAQVVITNPTTLAIAIGYESETMTAPKVMAKGAHLMAQRIVEIAKNNQVPVVQNIPLARAMYKNVEIDQEIPPEMYMAMAEVLAYVYRTKKAGLQVVHSTV